VPTGAIILGATCVREGDEMPTTGTLSLFIDDEKVGEGHDHDPARQLLARRRRLERRPRPGRTGHVRLDLEKEALALMKRE
jgi:hypothetical protein